MEKDIFSKMKKDKLVSFRTTIQKEAFLKELAAEDKRSVSFIIDYMIETVQNLDIDTIRDLDKIKINK
jgi:hypothetical protein